MANKKVKVLGTVLRVYQFDENRMPKLQMGFRDYHAGDVVELPDWVAADVLSQGIQSPSGAVRPVAIPAEDDEEDHVVQGLRDDVSPFPEADFGTTTVGGTLVSDPNGELAEQRQAARKAELTPQRENRQARPAHKSEG